MSRQVQKTNAMRLLDSRGITYTPVTYDPAIHSGEEVAQIIGEPAERVFKTLVVVAEGGGFLLVVIPSNHELDLKRCAASVGVKRVRMASRKEAEAKTGLLAGGISALALTTKPFRVYLDRSAQEWDSIYMSAGQRGYNLCVGVQDFLNVTGAKLIDTSSLPSVYQP